MLSLIKYVHVHACVELCKIEACRHLQTEKRTAWQGLLVQAGSPASPLLILIAFCTQDLSLHMHCCPNVHVLL